MNNFDKNKTSKNKNYNFNCSRNNIGNYSNNIILLDKKRAKNSANNKKFLKLNDCINNKSFVNLKINKNINCNNKNININKQKSKSKNINNNITNQNADKKIMKKSSTYQILPK